MWGGLNQFYSRITLSLVFKQLSSKHATPLQRRCNVTRRCSDVVTTLFLRYMFEGYKPKQSRATCSLFSKEVFTMLDRSTKRNSNTMKRTQYEKTIPQRVVTRPNKQQTPPDQLPANCLSASLVEFLITIPCGSSDANSCLFVCCGFKTSLRFSGFYVFFISKGNPFFTFIHI